MAAVAGALRRLRAERAVAEWFPRIRFLELFPFGLACTR